jgi:hypothetical protein
MKFANLNIGDAFIFGDCLGPRMKLTENSYWNFVTVGVHTTSYPDDRVCRIDVELIIT